MIVALPSWDGRAAEFALYMAYLTHDAKLKHCQREIATLREELLDYEKAAEERRQWMREIETTYEALVGG